MHWPRRIEEHTRDWLTDGHIEHDGLCDICGCAWPCPNIPLTPYCSAEPAPEVPRQTATDSRPVVYGYVRSVQQGRALLEHWQTELRSYCQHTGLRLVHCFCSMGRRQISYIGGNFSSLVRPYVLGAEANDTDLTRPNAMATAQPAPALRVLLTILEQHPIYGVVVPSIFHFATERRAAMALMQHIERLGTKVMVVPTNRTSSATIISPNNLTALEALAEPNRPASNGSHHGSRT